MNLFEVGDSRQVAAGQVSGTGGGASFCVMPLVAWSEIVTR